jgi:hypothetical protein
MSFKKLNNLAGWLAFLISLITFTLTVEPTASFWDCGEFIACAYKLQVPHPAGAPFFLLIGRIFSLFAGSNLESVAFMVNMVSVLASAFTILFLFWTISMIARKVVGKRDEDLSNPESLLILGSSMVGALAYNFSESFWFSAVEAEVYGMSSFFTAIVVWAAFKWERIEDPVQQNRWLIFLAYLVGVSIGVHLLNLVTIPALALLYYFKKENKPTITGGFIAFMVGMVILGIINVGVITGIPSISFWFELLFVNSFGLPFGSGMVFFILVLVTALVYGIRYTHQKGKALQNTILLCFAFVLIGFSTYTIALIRSNFNPPLNENNPSNVLNFTSYLKREQYGSRPLLYGPIFTAQLAGIERGTPNYIQGEKKYEIYDYNPEYTWDSKGKMLLPRIWSQDPGHISLYRAKLNLPEGQNPTFADNIRFMISHQFGHMYWRYFMWNFWGRTSDIQDTGFTNIFESKNDLPPSIASNKARTNFFGLPLILGIAGFLFLYFRREKDAIVTFLMFFLTGLALVVYLNSPPIEPRERDYIYAGSFYFFTIWIGLGVMAIYTYVLKFLKNRMAQAGIASALGLVVPVIMGASSWEGHDRTGRVHQIDFARNMLATCEPNAILFTGGDNDTFPLWYVQEVEGFRTDVRVCNLSLLGTDWYIEQMKRKTYESEALPITLNAENYYKGINDHIPYVANPNPQIKAGIDLREYINLIRKKDQAIQRMVSTGDMINILPSANFFFSQNAEEIAKMPFIGEEQKALITDRFEWSFGERDILKNDLIVLDIISNNNWKRPIYFGGTLPQNQYLGLKEFMQLEGYAYRLMPFKIEGAKDGFVNSDILKKKLMTQMKWTNLNNTDVYYDTESFRVPFITARYAFLRLADELLRENKKKEAEEVLDKSLEIMPDASVPYDQLVTNFPIFYYEIGSKEKGTKLADEIVNKADKELAYFGPKFAKSGDKQWGDDNIRQFVQSNMRTIQLLYQAAEQYDKDAAARYRQIYEKHLSKLQ